MSLISVSTGSHARVSSETDRLHHSLNAQVDYFKSLILSNPEWQFAGVFYDEGISGTSTRREGFQSLLRECEEGKVDIVLAKSISRFARNTVDMLSTARHFKEIGVEIRFENENLSTFTSDGELMLTLLSSFAEEESRNVSENIKWAIRKRFEKGKPTYSCPYGYDWKEKSLVVNKDEAEVVRRIFAESLEGKGYHRIAKGLKEDGITPRGGGVFSAASVCSILKNEKYTGDSLLQKRYSEWNGGYRKHRNRGERAQYYVENTHEPIIDRETFDKVTASLKEHDIFTSYYDKTPFSGKIVCGFCDRNYVRVQGGDYPAWKCKRCDSKIIREKELCRIAGFPLIGGIENISQVRVLSEK